MKEKKKYEQLIIFHISHCLIAELFHDKEGKGSADQFDVANQSLFFKWSNKFAEFCPFFLQLEVNDGLHCWLSPAATVPGILQY